MESMKEEDNLLPNKKRSVVESELGRGITEVENEYFGCEDSSLMDVFKQLDLTERRLLLIYAELASFRKVAKIYNCSEATIRGRIKTIRKKFEHLYDRRYEFAERPDHDNDHSCLYRRPLRGYPEYENVHLESAERNSDL